MEKKTSNIECFNETFTIGESLDKTNEEWYKFMYFKFMKTDILDT